MPATLSIFLGTDPRRGLLRRLRWWLLRRRSEAILRGLRLPAAWDAGVR